MKYRVFQNHSIREAILQARSENLDIESSWEKLFEFSPEAKSEQDTNFDGSEGYDAAFASSWKHKADIEAEGLEEVFGIGNMGPNEKITRYAEMRSLSVGDIVVDENGVAMMVDGFGFGEVDFEPENTYSELGALI